MKLLILYQVNINQKNIKKWLDDNIKDRLGLFSQSRKIGFNVSIFYPPMYTNFDEMLIFTSDLVKTELIEKKPFKSFIYKTN